jgi:predicted DNA binding CopG/RHH family protein
MKKKTKLDKYEQEIEDNLHKIKRIKNFKTFKKSVEESAKKHVEQRKSVTIRLLSKDIEIMKEKAEQMGVPYQTYINILIHRDAISTQ